MMLSLIFPFLVQILWICCLTHHIIGSGLQVDKFLQNGQ